MGVVINVGVVMGMVVGVSCFNQGLLAMGLTGVATCSIQCTITCTSCHSIIIIIMNSCLSIINCLVIFSAWSLVPLSVTRPCITMHTGVGAIW